MAHPRAAAAREVWTLAEPLHAVTYFSPEPLAALRSAGCRGFWMGYFAGRAAPLGAASPELVHALFHNFAFAQVARALPDAWSFATPAAALEARLTGSVATLARVLGDADVSRAADLAARAGTTAPLEGRALYAANRALPVPDAPLARLWHAVTLLREHRGDGHVAALTVAGVGGREAHVLHALATGTPVAVYETARSFTAEEWTSVLDGFRSRGLVDTSDALTTTGRTLKRTVEEQTDELAAPALDALTDDEVAELVALLRPLAAAVVAAGEIPAQSPMGLDLTKVSPAPPPA
ncbi:SCO6745 family protein [Nocardioides sp. LML1-1-1.1]|uniref:SCO6745 family protein n=1 Tax=Nocardioides sp. LML1-1-1.1 TaxID=3135248 RepID=UPI00343643C9